MQVLTAIRVIAALGLALAPLSAQPAVPGAGAALRPPPVSKTVELPAPRPIYEGPTPASCEADLLPDASQLSGACELTGAGCRYQVETTYEVVDLGDRAPSYPAVGYTPPARRTIDIKLRVPNPLPPGPLPVVIFSHGGADGANPGQGQNKLGEWAETVVTAGYVAINLGHRSRSIPEWEALCTTFGLSTTPPNPDPHFAGGDCGNFKYLGYDRPHDIAIVLDAIDDGTLEAQYGVDLDAAHVVVAGHSAGAGGALVVAGARRLIGDELRDYRDSRPVAFMAFSPQQALSSTLPPEPSDGFVAQSWTDMLARPVFTATGTGDDNGGEDPFGRRDVHYTMASGLPVPRYQYFVCDENIKHTNFSLEDPGPEAFERSIKGAAVAFLDGVVKSRPEARAWIDHENAIAEAAGRVEWNARTWTPVRVPGHIYVPVTHRAVPVPLELWYPEGVTGALPVVLWSHGGGPVTNEFNNLSRQWLETLASAGYVAVKINTVDRHVNGPTPDFTHCVDFGYSNDSDECTALTAASSLRDRALDAIATLDALPTLHVPSGATLDLARVAAAGWSGGSGMPLALAGATRDLMDPVCAHTAPLPCDATDRLIPVPGEFVDFSDSITTSAPIAYVALSPPGGYVIGTFRDAALLPSYYQIRQPLLTVTGAGDSKDNIDVYDRIVVYDATAAPRQFQLYINSDDATHDTFNLGNTDYPQYNAWVAKVTVAFLDAMVKHDAAAAQYLYSPAIGAMLEADATVLPGGLRPAWSTR